MGQTERTLLVIIMLPLYLFIKLNYLSRSIYDMELLENNFSNFVISDKKHVLHAPFSNENGFVDPIEQSDQGCGLTLSASSACETITSIAEH